ncbi:MAG: XRE family transcriptional regulator [Lachnospiraceae bacterium]|nr:XRE family transcriptional regulator [Lachnospiraceae bacterium]
MNMVAKQIKSLLAYKESSAAGLAEKLECSQANISQKFKRDNFSEKEMLQIADALGCDLKISFVDRETGKEF